MYKETQIDFIPAFERDGDDTVIIAGPCSAESESSVMICARALAAMGVRYFRAGLWKPRTHPGCYEGVGSEGLRWLRRVRTETGMRVYTEVGSARHLRCAVNGGIDGVWLGARTVANPFAVQEIADEMHRLRCYDLPVIVKNPVNPDLELWIGALERLHRAGMHRIAALHRGFNSYKSTEYRNPPQWGIPIELRRRFPSLTILHDPSHCAGDARIVPRLARRAFDLCFDGLMVEVHPNPACALSDAAQQLTPASFGEMFRHLSRPVVCPDTPLRQLRDEIDMLDDEMVSLLARRMAACRSIGEWKQAHNLPVVQQQRYAALLADKIMAGEKLGLDRNFLRRIFSEIHAQSVELQLRMRDELNE